MFSRGVSCSGERVEGGSVLSQSVLRGERLKGGVSNRRECLTSEYLAGECLTGESLTSGVP